MIDHLAHKLQIMHMVLAHLHGVGGGGYARECRSVSYVAVEDNLQQLTSGCSLVSRTSTVKLLHRWCL